MLNAPEKPDLSIPGEQELQALLISVENMDIQPYEDGTSEEPLLEDLQTCSKVISETSIEELNLSLWELSNGIKILLKPTDFKNDEILFQGFSPGGNSLVANGQYRSSRAATDIISMSGLGEFDLNTLNKKLAGKVVSVFPYIEELSEGVVGNASSNDVEAMFQMIYLYMTRPRRDSSAYLSYKTRMQGFIENRFSDPESAYYDTLRPLIETYLGSLPSSGREEYWKDVGVNFPAGVVKKTVYRGMENKSRVSLTFSGDYKWNRENNYAITSMASVLRLRLREIQKRSFETNRMQNRFWLTNLVSYTFRARIPV